MDTGCFHFTFKLIVMPVLQAVALGKQYNGVAALHQLNLSLKKVKYLACQARMAPVKFPMVLLCGINHH